MTAEGPDAPLQFLKGVGPQRARLLEKLGLRTVGDLLLHFPSRYLDRRNVVPLGALRPGREATVQGSVERVSAGFTARRGMPLLEVTIAEGGRRATLVWFRQNWRAREFAPGARVLAMGKVDRGRVLVEECEVLEEGAAAAGLVPCYPATEGLSRRLIRTLVQGALAQFGASAREVLPADLLGRRRLPGIADALREIHAPASPAQAERARRRFAYQELLVLQTRLARRRREVARSRASRLLRVGDALDFRIRALFPFRLTPAQDRAVARIRADLAAGPPMNRLLQGDVGSGKTAVAAYALLAAVGNRAQAALLAPTEILAEQHFRTFRRMLGASRVRMELVTGSRSPAERRAQRARLAAGEVDLAVGTHALVQEDVAFRDLALVVIDEQQKFGVLQRAALARKGARPHVLATTATPIPRTLALTLYGDMDLTLLEGRPPGRREVMTMFVPEAGRKGKLAFVRSKLLEGRQAYFVYPLVEESETAELRSARRMQQELQAAFPDFRVALVHGRMPPEGKDAAMEEFRSGRAAVLACTTVVEVGVDVPNATVMVIDHCERYGLSQLHQLRGRIGRGPQESFCILFGERSERTDVFVSTNDGFRIAEADLRLRGPGELGGTLQSGAAGFRAARLPGDARILEAAREDAFERVRRDPGLEGAPGLRAAVGREDDAPFLAIG